VPPTPKKGFLLRVPPELLDELRAWSAEEMRSLNGQIEWLLRDALRRRGRRVPPPGKTPPGANDEPGDGKP
jgi:hypothetical protein